METYPPVVQEFVASIQKKTLSIKPYPTRLPRDVAKANPEYAAALIRAVIENELSPKQCKLTGTLHFVPIDELPALAKYALDIIEQNPANEHAIDVVTDIIDDYPQVLHPYLRVILSLCEHASLYHFVDAWRGADTAEAWHLKDVYESAGEGTRLRNFALRALIETHCEPVLQQLVPSVSEAALREAGYAVNDGVLQRLFPSVAYHLRFPDDYPDPSARWMQRKHPTWHLPLATNEPLPLGGMVDGVCECRSCGEPIHHLLTLAPLPDGLGISGLASLTVAVCLSCLGWETDMETAFYRHDASGLPVEHLSFNGPQIDPEFATDALEPVTVQLSLTPTPWHFQHWNHAENLFRIGGHPSWVQSAQYPNCPACARLMPFLLQLDSNLTMEDVPFDPHVTGWLWGSGGVAYVHWCDHCRVSAVHWQCT